MTVAAAGGTIQNPEFNVERKEEVRRTYEE
jgi:hypothetical protein